MLSNYQLTVATELTAALIENGVNWQQLAALSNQPDRIRAVAELIGSPSTRHIYRYPLNVALPRRGIGAKLHAVLSSQGIKTLEDAALCYAWQIRAIAGMTDQLFDMLERKLAIYGLSVCPPGVSQKVRAAKVYGSIGAVPLNMIIFMSRADINASAKPAVRARSSR